MYFLKRSFQSGGRQWTDSRSGDCLFVGCVLTKCLEKGNKYLSISGNDRVICSLFMKESIEYANYNRLLSL